ncbi:archaeal fructose-1,6-bisphosphatase [Rubidibacter lacunae KORDI 51-2]|uniref:Archaeal fructose-1,6-bisphosphatase n=1 Tax=Rubidibacter lacunae KORDI 51-2 TaxID=582515 RepID=U5DK72_9CHRO|nr:inositol monophosphatase family protein [Rubidibacter lacunae]ERN40974.1 archaeal fructose-1,6-bisphosphatase [Rubidibacter lacunae KORDI 51-2]
MSTSPDWTRFEAFARALTARVGERLLAFGDAAVEQKADGSLVTEADLWADGEIRAAIAAEFPEHGVITEETEHLFSGTEWCWVVDPIDGTTNFTRGIPIWGTSMGLLYCGTPVFGLVHFPPLQQTFHGIWIGDSGLDGQSGAFLNGKPIRTSPDEPSSNHLFNACTRSTSVLQPSLPCKSRVVGVCTYSFLLVATGAVLAAVEAIPKVWDIAATWAILQAAGGTFEQLGSEPVFPLQTGRDYGSQALPSLVASRPAVATVFAPLVESVWKNSRF